MYFLHNYKCLLKRFFHKKLYYHFLYIIKNAYLLHNLSLIKKYSKVFLKLEKIFLMHHAHIKLSMKLFDFFFRFITRKKNQVLIVFNFYCFIINLLIKKGLKS